MRSKRHYLFLVLIILLAIGIVEFLHSRNSLINVSSVETLGNIGIYWDVDCSRRVSSICWGVLLPGETMQVEVYVRNEGNESFRLELTPTSWNPLNATFYFSFSCHCQDFRIEKGKTMKATLKLFVSPNIKGISNFGFNIIFEEKMYFLGDVNKDGVVDMEDLRIVAIAFGADPQDSRWNPDADVNKDGKVDMVDVWIVSREFGKIW